MTVVTANATAAEALAAEGMAVVVAAVERFCGSCTLEAAMRWLRN